MWRRKEVDRQGKEPVLWAASSVAKLMRHSGAVGAWEGDGRDLSESVDGQTVITFKQADNEVEV